MSSPRSNLVAIRDARRQAAKANARSVGWLAVIACVVAVFLFAWSIL